MELPAGLRSKGFSLVSVSLSDLPEYLGIKNACYRKYVDEYFGGWARQTQIKMNTDPKSI